MSNFASPSAVIDCFVRHFKDFMPEDQKAKLATHDAEIAATTCEHDESRALHCALWAIKAADDKSASHPRWKEIKAMHKFWNDTIFGTEYGLANGQPGVGEDVRIQWTESAAEVIRNLAEEDGWENSKWEELLKELIDIRA
jgi:hypothetical protein